MRQRQTEGPRGTESPRNREKQRQIEKERETGNDIQRDGWRQGGGAEKDRQRHSVYVCMDKHVYLSKLTIDVSHE